MRIALADHHKKSLQAFERLLGEDPKFDLMGVAENAQRLLTLAKTSPIDLFLVDRKLPGCPIDDLIESLHALDPRPFVIIMSSEFEYSRILLKAGADAFVSKGDDPEWLVERLYQYEERIKNED